MEIDFKSLVDRLNDGTGVQMPETVSIRIPDAEQRLRGGLDYFVNVFSRGEVQKAEWNERNYRPIVDWMTDNKGRGLLMVGSCGLGKSLKIGRASCRERVSSPV